MPYNDDLSNKEEQGVKPIEEMDCDQLDTPWTDAFEEMLSREKYVRGNQPTEWRYTGEDSNEISEKIYNKII